MLAGSFCCRRVSFFGANRNENSICANTFVIDPGDVFRITKRRDCKNQIVSLGDLVAELLTDIDDVIGRNRDWLVFARDVSSYSNEKTLARQSYSAVCR